MTSPAIDQWLSDAAYSLWVLAGAKDGPEQVAQGVREVYAAALARAEAICKKQAEEWRRDENVGESQAAACLECADAIKEERES